jgi:uncharacterized membrane protein
VTKNQFLNELNRALRDIPYDERRDVLKDYKEHFDIGMTEGKTEEEITFSLGNPEQIAREILVNYPPEKLLLKRNEPNLFRSVIVAVSLIFFNLIVVIGPFFGLIGILIGSWAVGLSFTISPFGMLFDLIIFHRYFIPFNFFASILLCGLGILITIGMFFVTKKIIGWTITYLKFNFNLIIGGR